MNAWELQFLLFITMILDEQLPRLFYIDLNDDTSLMNTQLL